MISAFEGLKVLDVRTSTGSHTIAYVSVRIYACGTYKQIVTLYVKIVDVESLCFLTLARLYDCQLKIQLLKIINFSLI